MQLTKRKKLSITVERKEDGGRVLIFLPGCEECGLSMAGRLERQPPTPPRPQLRPGADGWPPRRRCGSPCRWYYAPDVRPAQ